MFSILSIPLILENVGLASFLLKTWPLCSRQAAERSRSFPVGIIFRRDSRVRDKSA